MSDIIEFPGAASPEVDVNKLHAEAFEELENDICDIDRMAEITRDVIRTVRPRTTKKNTAIWSWQCSPFPRWRKWRRIEEKI